MPDEFVVVGTLPNGAQRIRFTSGPLADRVVIAFSDTHPFLRELGAWRPPESPNVRADRLLRSLLNADQLQDSVNHGTFRVSTRFGVVELGQLYDIGFWPEAGGELRLCVVPTQDKGRDLPVADQWINLLLVLQTDPVRFFTVANWRRPGGQFMYGPVPGLSPDRQP